MLADSRAWRWAGGREGIGCGLEDVPFEAPFMSQGAGGGVVAFQDDGFSEQSGDELREPTRSNRRETLRLRADPRSEEDHP